MSGSWVVIRDFKDLASEEEKCGGAPPSQSQIAGLGDTLEACQLTDLLLTVDVVKGHSEFKNM